MVGAGVGVTTAAEAAATGVAGATPDTDGGVAAAVTLRTAGALLVGSGRDTSGRDAGWIAGVVVFVCWTCLLDSCGTTTGASIAGGSASTVGAGSGLGDSVAGGSASCVGGSDGAWVVPGSVAGLDGAPGSSAFESDPGSGLSVWGEDCWDFSCDVCWDVCWDVEVPVVDDGLPEPLGPPSATATPPPNDPAENPARRSAASDTRRRAWGADVRCELGRRELSCIRTSDSS
ncbi:hypothetical protein JCM12141A_49750 [Mycolicibacterium hodleri]